MSRVSIGELSNLAGLSRDTIRYYEKLGLIDATDRTEGNYRLYKMPSTLDKLFFIKKAQKVNFSLKEIKQILDAGSPPCCNEVKALLWNKILNLQIQISELQTQLNFLESVQNGWQLIPEHPEAELCPLIVSVP